MGPPPDLALISKNNSAYCLFFSFTPVISTVELLNSIESTCMSSMLVSCSCPSNLDLVSAKLCYFITIYIVKMLQNK